MPKLSIIIPVYNESRRIFHLAEAIDYLTKKEHSYEIILVNDGSTDDTVKQIEKLNHKNIKIVSYSPNQGKGYAIQQGMLASTGDFSLFCDIDMSTPFSELDKFLPQAKSFPVVIGTRKTQGSNVTKRQSFLRQNMGRIFTLLSNFILQVPCSDFTCGFKLFSREAVQIIFPKLTIKRWGFDSEILFLASKYKLPIQEIPVTWTNDPNTKVKFPQDIIRSLSDLFQIRLNNLQGKY